MSLTRHYTLALSLALVFVFAVPATASDPVDRNVSAGEGIHTGYGPAAEPGGEGGPCCPRLGNVG